MEIVTGDGGSRESRLVSRHATTMSEDQAPLFSQDEISPKRDFSSLRVGSLSTRRGLEGAPLQGPRHENV
ncbi:hypothetical protein Dda_9315 [Drechslerella dactyloides]|uniref:Uncharacterized protein n=1 Tax=Drechslerella dactyloides TaxID=74499 RepID=A0AAD6IRS6_DREDA|nr:hypothetical protein Dda_9315 [Drechslerella dactyloides]